MDRCEISKYEEWVKDASLVTDNKTRGGRNKYPQADEDDVEVEMGRRYLILIINTFCCFFGNRCYVGTQSFFNTFCSLIGNLLSYVNPLPT